MIENYPDNYADVEDVLLLAFDDLQQAQDVGEVGALDLATVAQAALLDAGFQILGGPEQTTERDALETAPDGPPAPRV